MHFQLGSERARLIETLFSTAAGLTVQERASFLDHACGKDTSLRNEIESLLVVDTVDDWFIESAISDVAQHLADSGTGVSDEGMVGCLIGPYRIFELIGKGGMGAVYRAIREDQFRMQVALKVIRRGADTDYAVNQFRNERQILARLEHPNIARLLDGGTTTDGLPFFVLEYGLGPFTSI
jgi:eukaryotic-like serine/threonine-protein kinase